MRKAKSALEYIEMRYVKVTQPIGSFYIGKISWQDLIEIAQADIRKIEEEARRKDSFDSYLGIQRDLAPNRIKEIAQYVNTVDATFPTSIILAIDSETKYIGDRPTSELDADYVDAHFDEVRTISNVQIHEDEGLIKIRKQKSIASILDGQHRIEGLRAGFEESKDQATFEFNITLFIDLDIDDQAQIFSIINKAQTKVNKSLVYDLYEYARSRSPQKTAHDIVRLLNKKKGSPFYRKIKILGTAMDKEVETIAQATLAELIIDYISKNPMKDRDELRRHGRLLESPTEAELRRRPFRGLFVMDKDELIMSILWSYFCAISSQWKVAWQSTGSGNILNKSTGIIAFMRFLRPLYEHLGSNPEITEKEFAAVLKKISLKDGEFTKTKFIPGTSGQSALFKELVRQSGI